MKKKFSKEELTFHIEEILGALKESDTHDWAKAALRISWGDRPPTLDIRSFNFKTNSPGKGISLSEEEAESLVEVLLENEYGTLESLTSALKKKKSRLSDRSVMSKDLTGKGMFEIKLKGSVPW